MALEDGDHAPPGLADDEIRLLAVIAIRIGRAHESQRSR
jgi:hypothetical protein